MRAKIFALILAVASSAAVQAQDQPERVAAPTGAAGDAPGSASQAEQQASGAKAQTAEKSPEQKMRARFPQPVLVADLIGMSVIDRDLRFLGRVTAVAQLGDKIEVVILHDTILGFGGRRVALPVEAVAMLGDRMMLMDLPSAQLDGRPTWYGSGARELDPKETIAVGLTSR